MKIFKLNTFTISGIIMLMVSVLFSSCGKDEKDGTMELSGKWILKKEIYQEFINGEPGERDIESYSDNNNYFEFNDGLVTIVRVDDEGGERESKFVIPYTLSSDSKIITLNCETNDNNCPIIPGGIKIKEINSKSLVLYFEEEETIEGDLGRTTYKYTSELHFVR